MMIPGLIICVDTIIPIVPQFGKRRKLALYAMQVEERYSDPLASREAIFKAILDRYTLPA